MRVRKRYTYTSAEQTTKSHASLIHARYLHPSSFHFILAREKIEKSNKGIHYSFSYKPRKKIFEKITIHLYITPVLPCLLHTARKGRESESEEISRKLILHTPPPFFLFGGGFQSQKGGKNPVMTGFSTSCVMAGILNEVYSSIEKQESRF